MKRKRYLDICNRAHLLIAVSENTKNDMVNQLEVDENRIRVVPLATSSEFKPQPSERTEEVKRQFGVEGDYVLFVGSISRRKNVTRIVRAFARLRKQYSSPLRLVIVGRPTYGADDALEAMQSPQVRDSVTTISFCDRSQLAALYSGARLMLFPTLYEGFGLPVLESMACGTPVVTSNLSSLPEVAAGAALLVDPKDEEAIAEAALSLLKRPELHAEHRRLGFERAKQFSWTETARKTLAVYRDAAAMAGRSSRGLL